MISIIYSFCFSCFHYLVPGLGTKAVEKRRGSLVK